MFENRLDRFTDAKTKDESTRTLKLISQEIENKFRFDVNKFSGKWKYSYGGMFQYVKFNNEGFAVFRNPANGNNFNVPLNTNIEFFKYGIFGDVSRRVLADKLNISFGIRSDGNTFLNNGNIFKFCYKFYIISIFHEKF